MFFAQFFKFLRYFGKGYYIKLVYLLIMAFMTSLLEFISVVLVFPFILIMVNPGRVVNNPVALYISQTYHITDIKTMIVLIGCLLASVIIIKNLYKESIL